ncbi:hypothetical protein PENSPDRAFT_368441 [Peniophora sp. CONT]|nr:hypothetical protein PENSPDRAFT_368441 [Peniophora sp. CONT]
MSLGSNNAFMLLNHLIGVPDCRALLIQCYQDKSYRYTGTNGQPSPALDYQHDQKGTVVQQEMWRPMQPGDVHRHFDNARSMQWPIFFLINIMVSGVPRGVMVGIDLSLVGHASLRQTMVQPDMAAPLGGLTTTHLCLKWPGYREYKKQVEIQDAHRQPIRMLKLVERIARFVERWIDEVQRQPIDPRLAHWRVGPGAITKDHLYIVGLVHVSAGTWQPILQLKGHNFH